MIYTGQYSRHRQGDIHGTIDNSRHRQGDIHGTIDISRHRQGEIHGTIVDTDKVIYTRQ